MTESEEAAYIRGRKSVLREQLSSALRELDADGLEREYLIKERLETVAALRRLCDSHGDNDWPDNLHLTDVIDKHLGQYLK